MSPRRKIESYSHEGKKRVNNPPVGLVDPGTDPDRGEKRTYAYDPHLDPQLQWAGKAEHTSFEVPTVSLHVHERIDPRTIVKAVRKRNGNGTQASLFDEQRDLPIRQEIEFYKHAHNWSNRLIAGDSLLVMNSLLQKENMAGKVQCVYMDPPYGIKYGSNFQPFVNKRDVRDGKDEDLTAEPEMIKAFRDTWELGIHSYLSYMRDRLLLARELLTESGSVFVQISDENLHFVRCVLDEVFGKENKVSTIVWKKGTPTKKTLRNAFNYLLWYAKELRELRSEKLFAERAGLEGTTEDPKKLALWGDFNNGSTRTLTTDEKRNILSTREKARVFRVDKVIERGDDNERKFEFEFDREKHKPGSGYVWRGKRQQMEKLKAENRLVKTKKGVGFKFYLDDYPIIERTNFWEDTAGNISSMTYVVQTNEKIIQRCLLMTTDPGDLVFDPTCGSGTTAYVAEQWGRRWITCDTSRVATTLAKQRLMTATFDYYKLAYPDEGVGSGFEYKKVPHITLKSIANDEPHATETLYDQPLKDTKRARITGPFTVEAVPSPTVHPIDNVLPSPNGRGIQGEGDEGGKGTDFKPPKQSIPPTILKNARTLRKHQTDAATLLWHLLRDRNFCGFKFRRQHPVAPYILDFYCHEAQLGIELDGGQHNEGAKQDEDKERTEFLKGKGIKVIRFWNSEVLGETEEVLESVYDALTPALSQRERERRETGVSIGDMRQASATSDIEQAFAVSTEDTASTMQPIDNVPPSPAGRGIQGEGSDDIDTSIARSGETLRQSEWRDELLKTGIRGKGGQRISFSRVEPLPCRWLHADAETKPDNSGQDSVKEAATAYEPRRVVVSFGPEHAPLEQKQVELAIEEARSLVPKPEIVVFAAFQFDPEAAKDIDETNWPGMVLLKAQMNADMQTGDLKKKRASNESFWLVGQPDIGVEQIPDGEHAGKHRVSVHGFDYFNTKTGELESGDNEKIAVWMLDTDYDGRTLYPSQVFFPMADAKTGWTKLAKNLRAEIDETLIEAYKGTESLPFEIGENGRIAVKIVDDRGIESLKVVQLKE